MGIKRSFSACWKQAGYPLILFILACYLTIGFPLAQAQLSIPRAVAQQQDELDVLITDALLTGQALYHEGRFHEAAQIWQKAAARYEAQGDRLHQAIALSYLSLAQQRLGAWADATAAVNASLTLLTSFAPIDNRSPILIQALAQTLNGRGQLEFAQGKAEQAVATWQQATAHYRQLGDRDGIIGSLTNQVQALETLGLYRRACDTAFEALDISGSCKIENAAAITLAISQVLGASDQSNRESCQGFAVDRSLNQSTCVSSVQLLALRSLGQVLRLVGYLPQSQHILQQTLERAKLLQAAPEISATLLSLANTERALYAQAKDLADRTSLRNAGLGAQRQQDKTVDLAHQALAHYQEAIAAATVLPNRALQIQAQLPLLSLLIDLQQWLNPESNPEPNAAESLQPQIQAQFNILTDSLIDLPADRTAVYVWVGLAQSLIRLNLIRASSPWFANPLEGERIAVVPMLTVALQQAKTLQDKRAESYVLGTLGHWYEQTAATQAEQLRAQQLTQSALGLAQATQAWEIAYQWQWQLGRIYTQQRQHELAIAHYTAALETLKSVRADLRAIDAEIQFSFRDAVEPVYRELVELRLNAGNAAQKPLTQNDLRQIVQEIDALQVSELENFLRCNLTQPIELDGTQIDPTAAVIYPILLDNQMAIILRLPQPEGQPENQLETQSLYLYSVPLSRSTIEPVLTLLRQELERPYLAAEALAASQQVYDWLIRSFQPTLAAHQIKTLVFVLDGALRNIPMAALHNGEHFLVEEYAIALMPGLQLIPPTRHQRSPLSALTFGLSETRPNFPPHKNFPALANVETEIAMIQAQIPSRTFLNQKFTSAVLQELLQNLPVPIVHIATHGQFSSVPEETFILTWDERIDMNQLSTLLQNRSETTSNPIELLILSACKTADGDSRATLGLAGVALQSGARSTIASLWSIDDLATADLMGQFYREFIGNDENPAVTKAEALRRAQVSLLKTSGYQAPLFWAAYVLVGDWL